MRIESIGYNGINIYYNRENEICVPYNRHLFGINDPELMNYVSNFARNIMGEPKSDRDPYWDMAETKTLEFVIVYLLEETGKVSRDDIAKVLVDADGEDFSDFVLRCVNKRPNTLCMHLYEDLLLIPNKTMKAVLLSISIALRS